MSLRIAIVAPMGPLTRIHFCWYGQESRRAFVTHHALDTRSMSGLYLPMICSHMLICSLVHLTNGSCLDPFVSAMFVPTHCPLLSDETARWHSARSCCIVVASYLHATAPYDACGWSPVLYDLQARFTVLDSILMRCTRVLVPAILRLRAAVLLRSPAVEATPRSRDTFGCPQRYPWSTKA